MPWGGSVGSKLAQSRKICLSVGQCGEGVGCRGLLDEHLLYMALSP